MPKKNKSNAAVEATRTASAISINFDGKVLENIHFTFNDIAEAERELGCNLLYGANTLSEPSAFSVRALLYIALKRIGATCEVDGKQVPYTLQLIGDRIKIADVTTLFWGLIAAYSEGGMKDKNPPPAPEQPAQS